ncbi:MULTISPECIES: aldo/keto reductase [Catenuloplanes]|uniref:Aryl-alcohol dehydrogenase-like predicted oxidoreductase n=1 Tax=Catenuloplanes niger TaxID=587534 RepID=A0AAE3ZP01_9ACTN|nr:aldo/keto reductase [Catenuloplanes niger]MDR7321270.1 aryl-alcohol dehydrogenase-like predicted oxidoreductase [Catenuloplanes niger]
MKYTRLGATGLEVSRLCLGGMAFGEPGRGADSWTLPEDRSRDLIRRALEAGITFFDTANIYSDGSGEEILGRALRDYAARDDVVIATKVNGPMSDRPNRRGLSRKAILTELDNSLRRLGTDHIDLYQIHRWDPSTPVEETLETLDDVVRAGKVRYLGASSMWAWQFCTALHVAEHHGWSRFVSMQNYYNLIYREEEREMLPLCLANGVGVLPWSPLARGRLSRDWDESSPRTADDSFGHALYAATERADRAVAARLAEIAGERDRPRAQIALAWLLHNPAVTAPVIGVTAPHHLDQAIGALDVELSDSEKRRLEECYVPHSVVVL